MKSLPIILLTLLSIFTISCASLQPVDPSDTRKITLSSPAVGHDLLRRITLPAGTYRPASTDANGTYFSAPSSLIVQGIGSWMGTGGIYLPKDPKKQPTFYVTDHSGSSSGGFDKPLKYRLSK